MTPAEEPIQICQPYDATATNDGEGDVGESELRKASLSRGDKRYTVAPANVEAAIANVAVVGVSVPPTNKAKTAKS